MVPPVAVKKSPLSFSLPIFLSGTSTPRNRVSFKIEETIEFREKKVFKRSCLHLIIREISSLLFFFYLSSVSSYKGINELLKQPYILGQYLYHFFLDSRSLMEN